MAAKIEAFADGTRYVRAGGWRLFFSWLIDFLVFVIGYLVAFVVLAGVINNPDLNGGLVVVIMLGLLFAVPLLYGLFYTGGRTLGGVIAGTRLVRLKDGGRIGAKGPWAMLIRTVLLPLLVLALVFGGGADGEFVRTSIDVKRTRELQDHGYSPGDLAGLTPRRT